MKRSQFVTVENTAFSEIAFKQPDKFQYVKLINEDAEEQQTRKMQETGSETGQVLG